MGKKRIQKIPQKAGFFGGLSFLVRPEGLPRRFLLKTPCPGQSWMLARSHPATLNHFVFAQCSLLPVRVPG
ncbi:MAG: hypothetical protein UW95_C0016G0013 [Parcubacteria group bacterium GW2011_GWC1_45_14]|nr:MAG: hypothetical protein UW95_C0016G0013 [Parcubacteria group bacterium GW2011_GWC1_45_14]